MFRASSPFDDVDDSVDLVFEGTIAGKIAGNFFFCFSNRVVTGELLGDDSFVVACGVPGISTFSNVGAGGAITGSSSVPCVEKTESSSSSSLEPSLPSSPA